MTDTRNVTPDPERFQLFRLCQCTTCNATGKVIHGGGATRCNDCRGEGRTRELVATAGSAEAIGVALVTLGREGEWSDCPVGLLDSQGETGQKWLISPWERSPRNVTDAAKLLRSQQRKGKT